uniref:Myb-like domain-containing protein n=1 Tax=Setaria italica TaxID=4555 RepID=K3YLY2_SETIT
MTPTFTNLVNAAIQSSAPQNPNTQQQNGFSPHFPMNFAPHQFGPNTFPPQYYPQNFNPFGVRPGYHQFPASGYQHGIPFPGSFLGGDMAGGPSSPASSAAMFGVGGSRENMNKDTIRGEEWSDTGSDEEKKGGRMYWSEQDNLRLISAWINNSNDPIDGNSKKGPHYWQQVADEYNLNKRNKVSASGAYTSSSNQDTEEAAETERRRPPGQKQAKEQRKGKGKRTA